MKKSFEFDFNEVGAILLKNMAREGNLVELEHSNIRFKASAYLDRITGKGVFRIEILSVEKTNKDVQAVDSEYSN